MAADPRSVLIVGGDEALAEIFLDRGCPLLAVGNAESVSSILAERSFALVPIDL